MFTLHIPDVSVETVSVLKARAERANQSLEEYARDVLVRHASVMTWDEVETARTAIRAGSTVTADDVIEAIRLGREERDAEW